MELIYRYKDEEYSDDSGHTILPCTEQDNLPMKHIIEKSGFEPIS